MRRYPRTHVYHYAHYEPTALKRLASLHGTREKQMDQLLRAQVDLLRSALPDGARFGTIDMFQGQESGGRARVDDDVERRAPAAEYRISVTTGTG